MTGKNSQNGTQMNSCPLCCEQAHSAITPFAQDKLRDYLHCSSCDLVFVPKEQHLRQKEEVKRYDLHQNNPKDEHYRNFLSRLFTPLNALLPKKSSGLDFGSGPCPTLHLLFEEKGHSMEIFDIFYANNPSVFNKKYDFITATEVVEHLFHPGKELDRLRSCLKPCGFLGIMTQLRPTKQAFAKWHYKNDDTHVVFYSKKTFLFLKKKWSLPLQFFDQGVMVFGW